MEAQPWWLAIAIVFFGAGGFGGTWLLARTNRKVEGIKNSTALFDALAQRQNDEIARKDAELAMKDRRIDQLEAEIQLLEHQIRELHRGYREGAP